MSLDDGGIIAYDELPDDERYNYRTSPYWRAELTNHIVSRVLHSLGVAPTDVGL